MHPMSMMRQIRKAFRMIFHHHNRNLVIAAVGDESQHRRWIEEAKFQNFDLALVSFGNIGCRGDALYYMQQEGYKWGLISDIFDHFSLDTYDRIWCPDDDIIVSSETISKMFDFFKNKNLNLAQPSLTIDSHYNYSITRNDPECMFRRTNVVELMCPLFSIDTFLELKHTFHQTKSMWGYEWVWPSMLEFKGTGIMDEFQVKQAKPSKEGHLYRKYEKEGVNPYREKKKTLADNDIKVPSCVVMEHHRKPLPRPNCCFNNGQKDVADPRLRPTRRSGHCSVASKHISARLLDPTRAVQ